MVLMAFSLPRFFPEVPAPPEVSGDLQRRLGALAWAAVREQVSGRPGGETVAAGAEDSTHRPVADAGLSLLDEAVGVFVTLSCGGLLRGCLGVAWAQEALRHSVPRLASAASHSDPRFEPIQPHEISGLEIEVTCLGELTLLPGDSQLVLSHLAPTEHGVWMDHRDGRGLLLPQVARRQGWNAAELLENVALKAGVPPAAWREADRLFAFRAVSFDVHAPDVSTSPAEGVSGADDEDSRAGFSTDRSEAVGKEPGVLRRLREAGLLARKSLGQHFLHDPKLLRALVDDARLEPGESVFEVGTGPGTLTRPLAEQARAVLTVDVDEGMLRFAQRELDSYRNVRFLRADVLAEREGLHREVEAALQAIEPFVWVSNLPYGIATRLILRVCESPLNWSRAFLMVQEEVARRLVAAPNAAAYGPATALLAYWVGKASLGRGVPAGAFWPRPRVESRVVVLEPMTPLAPPEEYSGYRAWVKFLFAARRKQVGGVLRERFGRAVAEDVLGRARIDGRQRPESLTPQDFLRLARSHTLISP